MSLYKCKVLSNSGCTQIFKMDGFSKSDIIENLRKSSFTIINVKGANYSLNNINIVPKPRKVKSKELSLFCKQMSTMLKSGITIVKCLEILSIQTENKYFRSLITEMHKELLTGCTFSETINNHKEILPVIFATMVQAGELSGNIDSVMERMSIHYGKENKVENKFKSAMIYPLILSIVSIAVVIFLLIKVMPTFVDLYSSSGVTLPFMTLMLLNISQWIRQLWYVIILFAVVIIVGFNRLNKNNEARYMFDSLKLQIPFYGVLKVKLAASRFTRTLSTLLENGVPMLEGLETVSMIAGNEYISKLIMNAREDVQRGSSLAFSIKNQNLFPPIVYSMIKLGEESGVVEDILDKTADFFDEEVENAIQKLIAMVEPVMIVIMAAIIGAIMLAMVTPMFDMVNTIQ